MFLVKHFVTHPLFLNVINLLCGLMITVHIPRVQRNGMIIRQTGCWTPNTKQPCSVSSLTFRFDSCPKVLLQTLHSYLILPFCFFSGYGSALYPAEPTPPRFTLVRLMASSSEQCSLALPRRAEVGLVGTCSLGGDVPAVGEPLEGVWEGPCG